MYLISTKSLDLSLNWRHCDLVTVDAEDLQSCQGD